MINELVLCLERSLISFAAVPEAKIFFVCVRADVIHIQMVYQFQTRPENHCATVLGFYPFTRERARGTRDGIFHIHFRVIILIRLHSLVGVHIVVLLHFSSVCLIFFVYYFSSWAHFIPVGRACALARWRHLEGPFGREIGRAARSSQESQIDFNTDH